MANLQKWLQKNHQSLKTPLLVALGAAMGWNANQIANPRESGAGDKKIPETENRIPVPEKAFKFFEHHPSGLSLAEWAEVADEKFVNKRVNSFELYRPDKLSKELIEASDSLSGESGKKRHLGHTEIYRSYPLRRDSLNALSGHPVDSGTFKALNRHLNFLKTTIYVTSGQGHNLELLEKTDSELESRFKINYNVYTTKFNSGMYRPDEESRNAFIRDFDRIMLPAAILDYRRTAQVTNELLDSIDAQYKGLVLADSLKFEAAKTAKLDSLAKEANRIKLPKLSLNGFHPKGACKGR